MRIDAASINTLVQSSKALTAHETSISQQLSSGIRLTALSDDPLAAGQASTLSATLSQQDSFVATATTLQSRLTTADTALGSVVTQLSSAVSLAVQGSNGTESTSNRQAIASQLSGVRDTILSLANSSYSGSYLFSGTQGSTVPFTLNPDGSVTYNGDSKTSTVSTLGGGSISTSASGAAIFSDSTSSVFSALQSVISTLQQGNAPDSDQVANLRSSLSVVTTQRSTLDTSLSRLESESSYVSTQQANTKVNQSTLLSADTASLATDLSATESQQTALLSTLGVLDKKSLFDYL